MYDRIDWDEFLKKRRKAKSKRYTALHAIVKEWHENEKQLLYRAWVVSKGNVSEIAKAFHLSRNTMIKYLVNYYGKDYRLVLEMTVKNYEIHHCIANTINE